MPFLVTAFGVFFMRQAITEAVPDELLEAGRIDGCGLLRLWATSSSRRCGRRPRCSACSRS